MNAIEDKESNITSSSRLLSIDFMRGLVMVIMALDHIRDYIFLGSIDPLNMAESHPTLYFTRWITHLCAPVFVILAGVSVGIMSQTRDKKYLTRFLLTRGLWLILIELTVVSFGWNMKLGDSFFIGLQVIWALGFSMLCLAAFIWLPRSIIWLVTLSIIFGHNAFDGSLPTNNFNQSMPFWWGIHVTGFTSIFGVKLALLYPIIPWIGVMALGYLIAPIYQYEQTKRQSIMLKVGLACIVGFFILRIPNIYGNPTEWISQSSTWLDIFAIMNVEKYPPSLQYLLITLGISTIILALAENWKSQFVQWMVTFGRVPFFYYIIHLYLIHLIAMIIAQIQGFGWQTALSGFWTYPKEFGLSLWLTYLVWVAVIVILYPVCRWFMRIKSEKNDWWLKYL
tara:strand:+ start:3786 stop:4970 length:1185 start_codon:yes stop_codon:yes gene_type:complete